MTKCFVNRINVVLMKLRRILPIPQMTIYGMMSHCSIELNESLGANEGKHFSKYFEYF